MKMIILVVLVAFSHFSYCQQTPFDNAPAFNIELGFKPTALKVAKDGSKIYAGTEQGIVRSYSLQGQELMNFSSLQNTSSISRIVESRDFIFALDTQKKLFYWDKKNGMQLSLRQYFQESFGQLNNSMDNFFFCQNDNFFWLYIFSGQKLFQIKADKDSGNYVLRSITLTFELTAAQCSPDNNFLIIGDNDNKVYSINSDTFAVLPTSLLLEQIPSKIQNLNFQQMAVLTENKKIQSFTTASLANKKFIVNAANTNSKIFTTCFGDKELVVRGTSDKNLIMIYNPETGIELQKLDHLKAPPLYLDCSSNILISLDTQNNLAAHKFVVRSSSNNLAPWAIALISIGSVAAVGLILVIIYCCWRKRKQSAAENVATSEKQLYMPSYKF